MGGRRGKLPSYPAPRLGASPVWGANAASPGAGFGGVVPSCAYLLDGDFSALGQSNFPTVDIGEQSGSFTTYPLSGSDTFRAASQAALDEYMTRLGGADGSVGEIDMTQPGVVAAELILDSPADMSGGGTQGSYKSTFKFQGLYLESGSVVVQAFGEVGFADVYSDGSGYIPLGDHNGLSNDLDYNSGNADIQAGFRVGLWVDRDNKEIGFTTSLAGVLPGHSGSMGNFDSRITKMFLELNGFLEGILSGEPLDNQTCKTRLLTNAEDMELSYPAGATDICGNTL